MPVVEYKLQKVGKNAKKAPEWVEDGGYYQNPADSTLVGWVPAEADRDYYVPDTVTELSKDDFVTRGMTMHAANAFMSNDESPEDEPTALTDAEATTMLGDWYDSFIADR